MTSAPGPPGMVAIVAGETPPAMSISWEPPAGPVDSSTSSSSLICCRATGFEDLPADTVCLHCLLEDGDAQ